MIHVLDEARPDKGLCGYPRGDYQWFWGGMDRVECVVCAEMWRSGS